jgi:hypothetical protein
MTRADASMTAGWMALVTVGGAAVVAGAGCGGGAQVAGATVVAAGPERCRPRTDEVVEVRALFVAGGGCVALVDADVTPISARPAVWREDARGWRAVAMPAGDLENTGWAAAVTDGAIIVGVLDSRVEAPGWEALVLRSRDGGASWAGPVVLQKPYYLATVHELTAAAGVVALELELSDDYGSGVTPGRYRAESRDGGATWSAFVPAGR